MPKQNKEITGWVGWVGFASFMLMLGGVFSFIAGIVALINDTVVFNAATNSVWIVSYTQWGWVHMLIGVLAITAAVSLLAGHMYGRIITILVAFLSAIVNMAYIPIYPFWSIIIIVIDVLVIYAVTAHGNELRED